MEILHDVETTVLIAGIVGALAVVASTLGRVLRMPAPAIFLAAGVLAGALSERAQDLATFDNVATLGSFALIFILFEGGFSNGGWLRTGPCVRPILVLGVLGTLVTTALLVAACHLVLGLDLPVSVLIAVALAPTDPAAVFSVLGESDVEGSTDIILEGESGANDPVSISLMLGAIAYYEAGDALGGVAVDFLLQLVVGCAVGALAGLAMGELLRRVQFGTDALHALAATGAAFLTFALTAELHGSGFLAVFVAGLVVGRQELRRHETTEGILGVAAGLSEMVMFTALGLTVVLNRQLADAVPVAIGVFAMLTFFIRPTVAAFALLPEQLTRGERVFVAWGGLKGAVPILLASFPILAGLDDARLVYDVVFVAVVASVLIQGSTLPALARRAGLLTRP